MAKKEGGFRYFMSYFFPNIYFFSNKKRERFKKQEVGKGDLNLGPLVIPNVRVFNFFCLDIMFRLRNLTKNLKSSQIL